MTTTTHQTSPRRALTPIVLALAVLLPGCITVHVHQAPTEIESPTEAARRIVQEVRAIATALESYAIDANKYPSSDEGMLVLGGVGIIEVEKLRSVLSPIYVRVFPSIDPWGHRYLYLSTGQNYAVISTGADGELRETEIIETLVHALKTPNAPMDQTRSACLESETIFSSGMFIRWTANSAKFCSGSRVSWVR